MPSLAAEYRLRVWITEATPTAEFHFQNFASALVSAALAMNPPNFLAELKRRNVIRVAGLYLVGAWLLTQVASTMRRIDCRESKTDPFPFCLGKCQ